MCVYECCKKPGCGLVFANRLLTGPGRSYELPRRVPFLCGLCCCLQFKARVQLSVGQSVCLHEGRRVICEA